MSTAKLPATVQPQIWVRDNAQDAGNLIEFDAHDAMLGLSTPDFSRTAREILAGRHDFDDLALNSGVVDAWIRGHKDATFLVTVEADDFRDWLKTIGIDEGKATSMDEVTLVGLRNPGAKLPKEDDLIRIGRNLAPALDIFIEEFEPGDNDIISKPYGTLGSEVFGIAFEGNTHDEVYKGIGDMVFGLLQDKAHPWWRHVKPKAREAIESVSFDEEPASAPSL